MRASESCEADVQILLARRQALVNDGQGGGPDAQAITDQLTAMGYT